MSGRYPDLVGYDDHFLLVIFQTHCPAPTSVDDAKYMQNAYTILRARARNLSDDDRDPFYTPPTRRINLDIISAISGAIEGDAIGGASMKIFEDIYDYITFFVARAGWEFLDNIMGDPKKCSALYCDVGIRNARIAQRYMMILADPESEEVRRLAHQ